MLCKSILLVLVDCPHVEQKFPIAVLLQFLQVISFIMISSIGIFFYLVDDSLSRMKKKNCRRMSKSDVRTFLSLLIFVNF